ncbi:uncharacterized protein N7518_005678 [Penicillium psychrosexuale]|uniref:uncharacterized protein n=1 Tax=Penicillium psychrosexuale TaxID=1002107 RepID=UPI002544E9EB|nr:uncharacterized protein N7518_005678 [Penicillium psychrosexuale]KAJ5797138.1 hypothetical protein N7518_005678 [Penicillium psychrosexuale]
MKERLPDNIPMKGLISRCLDASQPCASLDEDWKIGIGIALRSYAENDKPKIAKLAREFNIPYQLLRGRINGAKSQKGRTGTHKALDAEQEEAVIQ